MRRLSPAPVLAPGFNLGYNPPRMVHLPALTNFDLQYVCGTNIAGIAHKLLRCSNGNISSYTGSPDIPDSGSPPFLTVLAPRRLCARLADGFPFSAGSLHCSFGDLENAESLSIRSCYRIRRAFET